MFAKTTDKKAVVDDKQLTKLAQPLIKDGLTASPAIKKLRVSGYSFSGKRVRAMFTAKPATRAAKPTADGKETNEPKKRVQMKGKKTTVKQPAKESATA